MFYLGIKLIRRISMLLLFCIIIATSVFAKMEQINYGIFYTVYPVCSTEAGLAQYYFYNSTTKTSTSVDIKREMIVPVVSDDSKYMVFVSEEWNTLYLISRDREKVVKKIDPELGKIRKHTVDNNGVVYMILEKRVDKSYKYDIYKVDLLSSNLKITAVTNDGVEKANIIIDGTGNKLAYIKIMRVQRKDLLVVMDTKKQKDETIFEKSGLISISQWVKDKLLMNYGEYTPYLLFNPHTRKTEMLGEYDGIINIQPTLNLIALCKLEDELKSDLFIIDLYSEEELRITDTPDLYETRPFWIKGDINEFRF